MGAVIIVISFHFTPAAEGDGETQLSLADPTEEVVVRDVAFRAEVIPELDSGSGLTAPGRFPLAVQIVRACGKIKGNTFKVVDVHTDFCIGATECELFFARESESVLKTPQSEYGNNG